MTGDPKKLEFHYRLNEAANAQDYTIFAVVLNEEEFVLKQIANELVVVAFLCFRQSSAVIRIGLVVVRLCLIFISSCRMSLRKADTAFLPLKRLEPKTSLSLLTTTQEYPHASCFLVFSVKLFCTLSGSRLQHWIFLTKASKSA